MAKPSGSMKTIRTTDGTDHEIIPDRLGNNGYVATPDTLAQDSSLIPIIDITASTFRIYGNSVGYYRATQETSVYTHATSTSSPYVVTARSGDIIHIVRIESNITYWVMYGGLNVNAVTVGYVSSGTSVMYTPTLDVENIKSAYVKSASVSGDVLTLTLQDNTTITFTGGGGGGSVSIDNTSITENSSNQIQTVGVIDQKTGNANKQWTGTLQEYIALGTHDANTFYNITNDSGGSGSQIVTLYDKNSSDSSINKGYTSGIASGTNVSISANSYKYLYITFQFVSSSSSVNEEVCVLNINLNETYNVAGHTFSYKNVSNVYSNNQGCFMTYRTDNQTITPSFNYNSSAYTDSDSHIKKIEGVK